MLCVKEKAYWCGQGQCAEEEEERDIGEEAHCYISERGWFDGSQCSLARAFIQRTGCGLGSKFSSSIAPGVQDLITLMAIWRLVQYLRPQPLNSPSLYPTIRIPKLQMKLDSARVTHLLDFE